MVETIKDAIFDLSNDIFHGDAFALIGEVGTALVPGPGGIEGAVMSKNLESDYLQLVKDADQDMKDFIVERLTESCPENRESAFTGDMFTGDSSVSAIRPSSVFITQNAKEMAHILMAVDITKKVEKE
jgi:hypothetical protein